MFSIHFFPLNNVILFLWKNAYICLNRQIKTNSNIKHHIYISNNPNHLYGINNRASSNTMRRFKGRFFDTQNQINSLKEIQGRWSYKQHEGMLDLGEDVKYTLVTFSSHGFQGLERLSLPNSDSQQEA